MSRRKQAKPRAVLKHGSEEEVQQDTSLVEAKEEAASDVDSDEDDQNGDDENDTGDPSAVADNLEPTGVGGKQTEKRQFSDELDDEIGLESHPPSEIFEAADNNEDDNSSDSFYSGK